MIGLIKKILKKTLRSQAGATAIEYGLIVGLMAAILVSMLGLFGDSIEKLFTAVSTEINEAADTVTNADQNK